MSLNITDVVDITLKPDCFSDREVRTVNAMLRRRLTRAQIIEKEKDAEIERLNKVIRQLTTEMQEMAK